jgi:hypothetical protein
MVTRRKTTRKTVAPAKPVLSTRQRKQQRTRLIKLQNALTSQLGVTGAKTAARATLGYR